MIDSVRLFLLAAVLIVVGCEKEQPAEAVPASAYIRPDVISAPTPPTAERAIGGDLRFTDVTDEAGIDFVHVTGAFGKKWMPETMGGGAGFFDFDRDDHPDILLINSRYWPGHRPEGAPDPVSRLYRNRGNGTFEDVTARTGLDRILCYGMGAAMADYDGDGDADVYITAVGKNHLLRNEGGVFVDVTDEAGVGFGRTGKASEWEWSTGAAWIDYDRDGDLDLFVANYVQWTPETDIWTTLDGKTKSYATPQRYEGATCVLFRNEGDGTFTDVTTEAGVYNPDGKSLSVVADDFNDDGWPDLVVTNDTQPNFLYINTGKGGFTDEALSAGVAYDENGLARAGMGVSMADLANGGAKSIAIGNFSGEPMSLYTQAGKQAFIDRAGAMRLANPTVAVLTFGVMFADMDLDGYDDLLAANGHIEPDIASVREGWTFAQPVQLFLNDGGKRLVEVTDRLGDAFRRPMVGRALAVADIDGDGDLDVLVGANGGRPRLIRNDSTGKAHLVRVRLTGVPPNREAIGARLRAVVGSRRLTRFVTTGGSYLSQSELTVTFGLGEAKQVDRLTIRWPDGSEETFPSLAADHLYRIEQGRGIVGRTPLRR